MMPRCRFCLSGLVFVPCVFSAVCATSSSGITAAAATITARTFMVGNYIAAAFFDSAYVCAATISAALLAIRSARSRVGVLVAPAVPACRPVCSCERISFCLTLDFLPPNITSFSLSKEKRTRDTKTAAAAAAAASAAAATTTGSKMMNEETVTVEGEHQKWHV